MSLNAGINATIALIENRAEQFKEMLRSVTSDVKDIGAVRARLNRALNFYSATKVRGSLMESLHLDPSVTAKPTVDAILKSEEESGASGGPEDFYNAGFYDGVRAVEKIFENLVENLEK